MTRDYELGFILNPEVNEEQTRAILDRVQQIATNYGGQVVRVNQWGRRRLAYPIEHHRDGYYVFVDMILTPETVTELDRNLKVSEEVLRHMIKRRDPKTVQKEREEREARAATAAAQPQTPTGVGAGGQEPRVAAPPAAEVEGLLPAATGAEDELEIPTGEDFQEPAVLTDEENDYVPPAIEEETIEA